MTLCHPQDLDFKPHATIICSGCCGMPGSVSILLYKIWHLCELITLTPMQVRLQAPLRRALQLYAQRIRRRILANAFTHFTEAVHMCHEREKQAHNTWSRALRRSVLFAWRSHSMRIRRSRLQALQLCDRLKRVLVSNAFAQMHEWALEAQALRMFARFALTRWRKFTLRRSRNKRVWCDTHASASFFKVKCIYFWIL